MFCLLWVKFIICKINIRLIFYFEKALEIGTYDIDVLLLKAYSHQKLDENKRAIQCCEKIQEIDPKNKSVFNLLEELN